MRIEIDTQQDHINYDIANMLREIADQIDAGRASGFALDCKWVAL